MCVCAPCVSLVPVEVRGHWILELESGRALQTESWPSAMQHVLLLSPAPHMLFLKETRFFKIRAHIQLLVHFCKTVCKYHEMHVG